MSHNASSKLYGVLSEFGSAAEVFHACEAVRDAGFKKWDAHTPYPVHGLDRAMGLTSSKLPWVVLVMGLSGAAGGMLLQWWTSAVDYPTVISAKPFFSWQAFVPIMFEIMVLFSALGAVFGMLHFNRLPRLHHPLFQSSRFERFSDDKFFISIEADDPNFNADKTVEFLRKLGAQHVELVQE